MEAPAPYHTAPKGPRDLSVPLAAWLRVQGFTATEQARSATCWLRVHYPGQPQAETLFTGQHVRRLREERQLLLGNVRYANARTLAKLVPAPADL